ncbi:uncharacterized protein JN550_009712 [Neoarthrinium moseri]|uniref:uncharacterized protein n=1 Tax=Neoarthrinium moseri TaxID=1658444 RepID=UPI001FDE9A49|nr:uncharacterized protein JN550_009712 [Neoarthrinium moseri]KAI1863186.1 hypothetical protein JN550_009712 [Neoarthrinium moseri]
MKPGNPLSGTPEANVEPDHSIILHGPGPGLEMSETSPNVVVAVVLILLIILVGALIWKARSVANEFARTMFGSRGGRTQGDSAV